MAIEKRITKNNKLKYRAVITQRIDGKRHRIRQTFDTRKEARAWEIEQLENLKTGMYLPEINEKFDSLALKWLEEFIKFEKSFSTYKSFGSDLRNHLLPLLTNLSISKINKLSVQKVKQKLADKGLAKSSINRVMSTFKSFVSYCVANGHIIKNPFLGYRELKIQRQQKEFWDKDDLKLFLENAKDDYYYDLYVFALNTGMRIGEISALKKSKINFKEDSILIDESRGKNGISSVKNYEIRQIYMNNQVKKILKHACQKLKPNDVIFKPKYGEFLYSGGFSTRFFIPLQEEIGIGSPITFHGLRHTFASHFVMNGGSIFDLQKILGHKSINSTMVYSHLSAGHMKEVMQGLVLT